MTFKQSFKEVKDSEDLDDGYIWNSINLYNLYLMFNCFESFDVFNINNCIDNILCKTMLEKWGEVFLTWIF